MLFFTSHPQDSKANYHTLWLRVSVIRYSLFCTSINWYKLYREKHLQYHFFKGT